MVHRGRCSEPDIALRTHRPGCGALWNWRARDHDAQRFQGARRRCPDGSELSACHAWPREGGQGGLYRDDRAPDIRPACLGALGSTDPRRPYPCIGFGTDLGDVRLVARPQGQGPLVQRHGCPDVRLRHDGVGLCTPFHRGVLMGLSWLSIVRLGLVQMALGAIIVLTTSTLNRLMVVELSLPAILPGLLVGLHYGIQLTRPHWGFYSDAGGHRTRWIIGGMVALALGAYGAAHGVVLFQTSFAAGLTLSILAYALIGVGVGASGTSLLALLATATAPRRRRRRPPSRG